MLLKDPVRHQKDANEYWSVWKKLVRRIRNIGVMAHIDAGKTTLTERILFLGGVIYKIGETHDGKSQMDFLEQERKRGITITSAATVVNWKGPIGIENFPRLHENLSLDNFTLNIIDTPGHIDFTAEVQRSLRVLDGSILVIDVQAGVEPQTETVWMQANEYKVPRIIFLNKMDKVGANFFYSIKTIEEKLDAKPLVIQLPIGSESSFKGVVDIISRKAYYGKDIDRIFESSQIPVEMLEQVESQRQLLIETLVENDDTAAELYLAGHHFSDDEILVLVRKLTLTGTFFPVLCGTAFKNIGVRLLLDAVVSFLPSPSERKKQRAILKEDNTEVELADKDLAALAFKVTVSKFGGRRLTFIRVYSGKLTTGEICNSTKGTTERITQLVKMHANKEIPVDEVSAGDICVAIGLKATTGDTLCHNSKKVLLEKIVFNEPVISFAVEAVTKDDQDNLVAALGKVSDEDPTFKYGTNKQTNQMIISGMGELHLEVIKDRLLTEHRVNIITRNPEVNYKETIVNTVNCEGKYIKQTGGHGQFGHVKITFEPNPGKGFEFVDAVKGGAIPNNFIDNVRQGLVKSLSSGLLLGYPTIDVKATLFDGSYHDVDSSELSFEKAGEIAFRENRAIIKSVLLEPIMKVMITVPSDFLAAVIGNVESRRGIIDSSDTVDSNSSRSSIFKVDCRIPLSSTFGFMNSIRTLTSGKGNYNMSFLSYEKVPENILNQIIEKRKGKK